MWIMPLYLHINQKSDDDDDDDDPKYLDALKTFAIPIHKFEQLQGPAVQSIISLTSSLVVKMLTVLVSTISNTWVFLLKKM